MNSFHACKFGKGKKKRSYFEILETTEKYPIQHAKQAGSTHTRLYDVTPNKKTGKPKDSQPVMVGNISEPEPARKEYQQRTVNQPSSGWKF